MVNRKFEIAIDIQGGNDRMLGRFMNMYMADISKVIAFIKTRYPPGTQFDLSLDNAYLSVNLRPLPKGVKIYGINDLCYRIQEFAADGTLTVPRLPP
jgi:hypothetical protein